MNPTLREELHQAVHALTTAIAIASGLSLSEKNRVALAQMLEKIGAEYPAGSMAADTYLLLRERLAEVNEAIGG